MAQTRARLRSSWSRKWEADPEFREHTEKYYLLRYSREAEKRRRWAYKALVRKAQIKSPSLAALRRHNLVEWFEEWRRSSSADSGTTPSAASGP